MPPRGHVTKIVKIFFLQNFPKQNLLTLRKFVGPSKRRVKVILTEVKGVKVVKWD